MKKHLILFAAVAGSFLASAQDPWAIKTNLTDLVVGRYSIGAETQVSDHVSIGLDVDLIFRELFMESSHPWYPSQQARKTGVILQPQLRWHPGGKGLLGTYASLDGYFGFASYHMDMPLQGMIAPPEWQAAGGSLHLGHQLKMGKLLLDSFLGATWALDDNTSIYQESTALFPPPTGLRMSGGIRLGLLLGE